MFVGKKKIFVNDEEITTDNLFVVKNNRYRNKKFIATGSNKRKSENCKGFLERPRLTQGYSSKEEREVAA